MRIDLNQAYSFCQLGKRDNQEDSRFPDTDIPVADSRLFVVCDGVGGMDKGEIASKTVCDAFGRYFADADKIANLTPEIFSQAYSYAYAQLFKAMDEAGNTQMATTLTFVCFGDNGVSMAHVGDSRIYQFRPEVGVYYRSNDHSLVNALVHSGNITPEEAIDHPQSNYITRCMCHVKDRTNLPACNFITITDVEAGDIFLLCSDGVSGKLSDQQLFELLTSDISDADKIRRLSELTADSDDNNTCYLISVRDVINGNSERQADCNEDISASSIPTRIITNKRSRILEVKPYVSKSSLNRIISFFKNLF